MAVDEAAGRAATRFVLALITASAVLRLVLAAEVGLSVDESYAVSMARQLEASYFDHPPAMFWLAGAAGRVFGGEWRLAVRLPFIAMFAATTWLLYRTSTRLFGHEAGRLAALALNLGLFFSVCAGLFVLPDGPLLFASALALHYLTRALFPTEIEAQRGDVFADWLRFGFAAGVALLSKYHAVFLFAGAFAFLLTSRPHRFWLRRPEPLLATVVALVVFLPVLGWNAAHDWSSFRFQGGRVAPLDGESGTPFFDGLLGQLAWLLPWLFVPLVALLVQGLRRGPADARRWLLVCLATGPIVGFALLTASGTRGLAHWTMPGYFALLPILGASLAGALGRGERWTPRFVRIASAGSVLAVVLLGSHAATGWLSRVPPGMRLEADPTDDLIEWSDVRARLAAWGYPRRPVKVVATLWSDGAKLAHALGPDVPVACIGGDPRGFALQLDQRSLVGSDLLLVVRRRRGPEPMVALAPYFERIQPLGSFPAAVDRPGRVILSVYVGKRLLRPIPPHRTL